MKLILFTKEDAPIMRDAIAMGKELEDAGLEVEFLDTDSQEGSEKARLYDIYSTPSFLIVKEDGSVVQLWREIIPPRGELEQLLRS